MSPLRPIARAALTIFALGAALAVGVAAASCAQQQRREPGPSRPQVRELAEAVSATSAGIELSVLGATFSGTGTLLHMDARIVDEALVRERIGQGAIRRLAPASTGFSGPFAGSLASVSVTASSRDGLLVRLPALAAPQDYAGVVAIVVNAVDIRTDAGVVRLDGNWEFDVAGPAVEDLAAALRLEDLQQQTLDVDGMTVTIRGQRSTSEMRITASIPSGLIVLTGPYLIAQGGERVATQGLEQTADGFIASFPPTEFGQPITFDLGPISISDADDSLTFTVRIGAAMRRAEGGPGAHGDFAIDAADVLTGNAALVIGGERGSHPNAGRGAGEWVGLKLRGNWHRDPRGGDVWPSIFDGNGEPLTLAGMGTNYTKDLEGNVGPGETSVQVFIDDPSALEVLTVVMGPRSTVLLGDYSVTLTP